MNKKIIIGIAGIKNSGKDTIGKMISYIDSKGSYASYKDYILSKSDKYNPDNVIHFADCLKRCLSDMFNIPLYYLNDRKIKDEYWFCLNNYTFGKPIHSSYNTYITIEDLNKDSLNAICQKNKNNFIHIKLRTLLQYFGTDLCRNQLYEYIWINKCLYQAQYTADAYDICCISDVRFQNEAEAILNIGKLKDYLTAIILVNRKTNSEKEHISELLTFNNIPFYKIDNNGNLMNLFYKVNDIFNKIKNA